MAPVVPCPEALQAHEWLTCPAENGHSTPSGGLHVPAFVFPSVAAYVPGASTTSSTTLTTSVGARRPFQERAESATIRKTTVAINLDEQLATSRPSLGCSVTYLLAGRLGNDDRAKPSQAKLYRNTQGLALPPAPSARESGKPEYVPAS